MNAESPDRSREPSAGGGGVGARNLGLDVARTAAILMVLGSHVGTSIGSVGPHLAMVLDTMGQAGVELFFSLSGFLIGGILLRMARRGLSPRSVGRFMVRRWFRTLPLYMIMLVAAGAWFGMDIRHSLLLVQNFFPTEPRALPVSWSLVMEEYFYVAFPLAMLALHAAGLRGARLVSGTAIGFIVCCTGVRLWNAYGFGPNWSAPFVHENPLLRLDCAAYGSIGAWLNGLSLRRHRTPGWVLIAAGLLTAAASSGLLVWVLGAHIDTLVAAGFLRWGPAFLALQTTASDAGFALVVVGLARATLRWAQAPAAAVTGASLISYSIYLVHVPIIGIVETSLPGTVASRGALAVALTVIVSTGTYRLIERPFLRVRDTLFADPERRSGR